MDSSNKTGYVLPLDEQGIEYLVLLRWAIEEEENQATMMTYLHQLLWKLFGPSSLAENSAQEDWTAFTGSMKKVLFYIFL